MCPVEGARDSAESASWTRGSDVHLRRGHVTLDRWVRRDRDELEQAETVTEECTV